MRPRKAKPSLSALPVSISQAYKEYSGSKRVRTVVGSGNDGAGGVISRQVGVKISLTSIGVMRMLGCTRLSGMTTRSMSNCDVDDARRFLGVVGALPTGVGGWLSELDAVRLRPMPLDSTGVPGRLPPRLGAGDG